MPSMRMLDTDRRVFAARWPDAEAFLTAATLRDECYTLARRSRETRTHWMQDRISELLRTPACREPWFVVQLRGDARDNIEPDLIEAGL